jgi:hypothetical protein
MFLFLVTIICSAKMAVAASNKSGFWRLTAKEISWVKPWNSGPEVRISDIPWGETFNSTDGGGISYSGREFNMKRTEKSGSNIGSITFTWSKPPAMLTVK